MQARSDIFSWRLQGLYCTGDQAESCKLAILTVDPSHTSRCFACQIPYKGHLGEGDVVADLVECEWHRLKGQDHALCS